MWVLGTDLHGRPIVLGQNGAFSGTLIPYDALVDDRANLLTTISSTSTSDAMYSSDAWAAMEVGTQANWFAASSAFEGPFGAHSVQDNNPFADFASTASSAPAEIASGFGGRVAPALWSDLDHPISSAESIAFKSPLDDVWDWGLLNFF